MNALRSTVARASIRATQRVQKRQMGSGAAAPEWTGIDKIVRDKFPEDYQVAGVILGGYAALFALVKIMPSGSKEEAAPAPVKAAADTGSIPSVDDDNFADFIENEANLNKWIDSAE